MATFQNGGRSFARRASTMTASWVRKQSASQSGSDASTRSPSTDQRAEMEMSRVYSNGPQVGTCRETVVENPIFARRTAATSSRRPGGEAAWRDAAASTRDREEGDSGGRATNIDEKTSDDHFDVELGDDVIQVEEVIVDDETPARHQGTHTCAVCCSP